MNNDYHRKDFFVKLDSVGIKHYYFRVNGIYHEVRKDVFKVFYNSYKKQQRDSKKDINANLISLDGDINFENALLDSIPVYDANVINIIDISDRVKEVMNQINKLQTEDRDLITNLLIREKTERELAKQLNVSQTTIHKRKVKIIKKIKRNLMK